jgi:prevent-host-death family protein
MKSIPVYEAKNRFSAILVEVGCGEEFVVTRHGEPVARIVPMENAGATVSPAEAVRRRRLMERLLAFREAHPVGEFDDDALKAAIEEGRD